jgi:serine/threonine protein kinase
VQPSGRTFGGRYELVSLIATGGMGQVWQARDTVLNRDVAVKVLRSEYTGDPTFLARFRAEAQLSAGLQHPNIATLFDYGEVHSDGEDLAYLVMELVRGESLSALMGREGQVPADRTLDIVRQSAAGLAAAHGTGVVHRDVKPGNVLLTADGRAILTDFGIATMAGDPALTSTGVVLGSPAYMSPERARGKKPGAEADMWSLGATLYSAAEGRPPYDGENALSTLTAVISDPVEPPRVGGPLGEAILGLLAKEPADRMSIAQTRDLLSRAAAQRDTSPTLPVTDAADLDRAGRTEALPVGALAAAAPRTMAAAERSAWQDGPPTARRPRSNPAGWLLAALLVLGLGAGLAYLALRDNSGPGAGPIASDSPSASTRASTSPSASPSATPSRSTPSASSTPAQNGVPAGYTLHHDPTGFSVAVPTGWRAVRSGTHVDYREPGGSRYLRVDQTDNPKPDAKKDWQNQEKSVSKRLPDYRRIRIDRVDYRDYNAADWEFTWGSGPTHVLNRGMNTGAKGYALYWSTPDSQWDQSRSIFTVITDTFQPAG